VLAAAFIGAGLVFASCGGSAHPKTVRLVRSGGCRDGFFWASNADDTVALTVSMHLPLPKYDWGDTFDISKGSLNTARTRVTVALQHGHALSTALCTDAARVGKNHKIENTEPVVEGEGDFVLDFRTCPSDGYLDLTGLKAKDGSRIVAPQRIETHRVGCATG
jgi:hypothetical protein